MLHAKHMKRTSVFLDEELESRLDEASARLGRAKAEIVRAALDEYLRRHARPWPSSIGVGESSDDGITSVNVKEWVHRQWSGQERDPES
jgi:predicted transcriptional regulator